MRTMKLGCTNLEVPVVAVGCMRLKTLPRSEAERFLRTAIDSGLNFFDHADVYGDGESETLEKTGAKHGVGATTAAIAWLLRHPARLMPVIGTTNAGRLQECAKAAGITLTREEWYAIYMAAGNTLP